MRLEAGRLGSIYSRERSATIMSDELHDTDGTLRDAILSACARYGGARFDRGGVEETLEWRDLMTFTATHLEVLARCLRTVDGAAATPRGPPVADPLDALRTAIFLAYAEADRRERERPSLDDEWTRCERVVRFIHGALERWEAGAANGGVVAVIFAFWREVEVARDAPAHAPEPAGSAPYAY
jgi:hypothetical protein